MTRKETCIDCGVVFEKKKMAHQLKRCPECQKKHKEKQYEESKAKNRRASAKRREEKMGNKATICPRKETCIYRGYMGGTLICNYLLINGHKRPCGPVDCTEYKKGRSISVEED